MNQIFRNCEASRCGPLTESRFAGMRCCVAQDAVLRRARAEGDDDRALHLVDAERAEGVDHAGRGGLPYRVHPIDIEKGEQFRPEFLTIAPNNKIPAIIDTDNGLHLMESGAILLYLAEKTGRLWPQDFPVKWRVVEWLMWQMGGPGPFLGQVHHFVKFNPGKSAYAEERYTKEAKRLWGVLDRRLARGRLCRRRLFHRRYRDLALDLALRMANGQFRRLSQCEALVSGDRGTACGASAAGTCRSGPRHPHALNGRRTASRARGCYGRIARAAAMARKEGPADGACPMCSARRRTS